MYKFKKMFLYSLCFIYLILFVYELINYLLIDSNVFGLIYNLITVLIIFFFVTVTYNYKNFYSKSRISKIIIIVITGLFLSFALKSIVLNTMTVNDSSLEYYKSIFISIKIVKPIVYFLLIVFIFIETNLINNKAFSNIVDKLKKK